MCIIFVIFHYFPPFNNWTPPLNVLFAWFGLVWFLMSDSLSIVNLIDCFFHFVLEYLFKVTSIMWTLSCWQAPPHLQCIVNCCQVTMDKHRVSRPREQPLQTPFVSLRERLCPVFSLHNHPVSTSCHFMTAKSEESAAVPTNDPSTHPALQNSLVGSCFCL